MNLSKITSSVVSFLTVMSLSAYAASGTADIAKKQLLQQFKCFQLSQVQPHSGKVLQKVASGSKTITVADSLQTFVWENSSWEKNGCVRYSYDSKGRIKEELVVDETQGYDSKNTYEYDADGKTIKTTSIWNLSVGGELFLSDTSYSINKYYPNYTDAIIQAVAAEYSAILDIENSNEFNNLDSVLSIVFDASRDTTFKSFTKYTKISDKIVRSNITFTSWSDEVVSMSYHTDYITSGSGGLDTTKCLMHFDGGSASFFEDMLSDMQFMMVISKANQGHIVEQTALTAKDSTFASRVGSSKMSFYIDSKGDIDSLVMQEWDTLQNVWKNTEKAVYTLKKITVGVEKGLNKYQSVQQITSEWKNGILYLTIPNNVVVTVIEQIDLQGKVIARTALTNAKNNIALSPVSKSSSRVKLVCLKTDRGDFTCKVSSVK